MASKVYDRRRPETPDHPVADGLNGRTLVERMPHRVRYASEAIAARPHLQRTTETSGHRRVSPPGPKSAGCRNGILGAFSPGALASKKNLSATGSIRRHSAS